MPNRRQISLDMSRPGRSSIRGPVRLIFVWMAGCAVDPGPGPSPRFEVGSGVSVLARQLDGTPATDAVIRVGGYAADPGQDGVTVFAGIFPGRAMSRAIVDQEVVGYAPVEVQPGLLHGLQQFHPSLESWPVDLVDGAGLLDAGNGLTLDFPSGSVFDDEQVFDGTLDVGGLLLQEAGERALPGDFRALYQDEVVVPIELFEVVRLIPFKSEADWRIDAPATLSIPVDSSMGAAQASSLALFSWDGVQGYWKEGEPATLLGDQVSGTISQFSWWAVGTTDPTPLGCVMGEVLDPSGVSLTGAELLVQQAGRFGAARTWTDASGVFCVEGVSGQDAEAQIYGIDPVDNRSRYVGAAALPAPLGEAGCGAPGVCASVGALTTTRLSVRR